MSLFFLFLIVETTQINKNGKGRSIGGIVSHFNPPELFPSKFTGIIEMGNRWFKLEKNPLINETK